MSMSQSIFLGYILHYITLTVYEYCKGDIQMTRYHSTIDVEEEIRKCQCQSIFLGFILHYITLTVY